MRRSVCMFLLAAATALGCASSSSSSGSTASSNTSQATASASTAQASVSAAPATADPKPVDAVAVKCGDPKTIDGKAAFDRAQPLLKKLKGEVHLTHDEMKSLLDDLEAAASVNVVEAQYTLGTTLFGTKFGDHAPEPAERDDYVKAFRFIRVAAKKGHKRAQESFPELSGAAVSLTPESPLAQVPREWVDAGFREGDAWLAQCK